MYRKLAIILVSGRSALLRVGGVPSVARHEAAVRRLGMDPLVVYPDRRRALGAEAAGYLSSGTPCIAASDLSGRAGGPDDTVLVLAADWYLSFRSLEAFCAAGEDAARARVASGELASVPMARLRVSKLESLLPHLAERPVGALIGRSGSDGDAVFELASSDQQRLSDNVSLRHAEDKLFTPTLGPNSGLSAGRIKRALAAPLVRACARVAMGPLQVSAMKLLTGFYAAYVLAKPGYENAIAGAVLFFGTRVLDGVAATRARASLRDSARRQRFDFVGDVAVLLAVLLGVGLHCSAESALPGQATPAVLVALASSGVVIGSSMVYKAIFPSTADALSPATHPGGGTASAPPTPRLLHRDGAAYGLLLAAVLGRLDLFLWSAALASHLFYILWMAQRGRSVALKPST